MSLSLIDLDEMVKVMNMGWEKNRLATFKSWIFADDTPCSALKMAEAGFFFTGTVDEPDAVQCFLCQKSLDGWEKDDDPWEEHRSHAAYCAFATLQQPEDALMLTQLLDFHKDLLKNYVKKTSETKIQELKQGTDVIKAELKRLS